VHAAFIFRVEVNMMGVVQVSLYTGPTDTEKRTPQLSLM
jgi:hypothetical protein